MAHETVFMFRFSDHRTLKGKTKADVFAG